MTGRKPDLELTGRERIRYLRVRRERIKQEKDALKRFKLRQFPPSMRAEQGPVSVSVLNGILIDHEDNR